MSRSLRWYVPFSTLKGNTGQVNIYQEYYSGTPVELTGGGNVITTDEDKDDDMLLPVRGHSGYLRIVDETGESDAMMPTDDMQHYVEILVNSSVVWCGYMAAAAYSVAWDAVPLEVEFPLNSGLSVLGSKEMDSSRPFVVMTFAAFLAEAIEASGVGYNEIYYPAEFTEENGDAYYFPFQCECSRNNFFDYEDNANEDGEKWSGRSYKEMLEIWCRLWGWSLHERGKSLYFVSQNTRNYEKITKTQLDSIAAGGAVTPVTLTANMIAMSDLILDGDSNTKNILKGCRKINVVANVNEIDGRILDLDATGIEIKFYDKYEGGRESESYPTLAVYRPTSDNMQLKAYKISSGGTQAEVEDLTKYVDVDGNSVLWSHLPAAVIYESDDERAYYVDITKPRDKNEKAKQNYSISRKIRLNKWQVTYSGRTPTFTRCEQLTEFIHATSEFSMNYNSGAIVIAGEVGFLNGSTRSNALENTIITDPTFTGLECRLKVGDKYWDGSEWTNITSTFTLLLDPDGGSASRYHQVRSNKSLSMVDYNGETGFIIPVEEEGLSGAIDFWIFDGTDFTVRREEDGTDITRPIFCIKSLSITYNPGLSTLFSAGDRDTSKNTYSDKTGGSFSNDKDVELDIQTDNYNGSAYSTLTKGGENVTLVQHVMYGLKRVEMCLLGTLKRIFGRIIEKLTVRFEKASIRPIDRISRGGRKYQPIAESVDWIDDSAEYTMEEVATKRITIYVWMTSAQYASNVRIINYYASEELDVALPVTLVYTLDGVETTKEISVQYSTPRNVAGGTGAEFEWVSYSFEKPSGDENEYIISLE